MITKDNVSHLQSMIEQVTSMVNWVNSNTNSAKKLSLVSRLVDCRRRLKRIKNALTDNPTIAAYGESQQGKSYIISSLLSSSEHSSLMVSDGKGSKINFIEKINMRTDSQESTGVVTRFTTSVIGENPDYPIKLQLLSIADFVTILADAYMKDITGYQPYSEKDLSGITERLIERYSDREVVQNLVTEDEIGDIEEYIRKHDSVTGTVYIHSGYFNVLSTIIRKIPESEWVSAFSPLWKEDETLSKLFALYLSVYASLNYFNHIYITIQAVLNDFSDGSPTLMCVRALDGLKDCIQYGADSGTKTEVLLPNGHILNVNKCMLSLMTAEAVYHVDKEILKNEISFNTKGIRESESTSAEENLEMLKKHEIIGSFTKKFLEGIDFLDFPGARGRDLGYLPSQILNQINVLLLRCKVSYLFNKYSEELKLSILMFCHSQGNTTPNLVAPILKSWVETYIGNSPEARQKSLSNYNVPPLFLISTMYNLDLVIKRGGLDTQIWERRLNKILYGEVISGTINRWFDEWVPGRKFDNTFLIRDYFYSSDANEGGKIFKGYPGVETEELQIEERAELKNIFLKDSGVKRFFSNPELAWDVSSTIGNDGTYYMLKRLSEASSRAAKAREIKFNDDINRIMSDVLHLIADEYKDENEEKLLGQSIGNARKFHFMLRRACEKRNDFFGRMIQFLQLNTNFVTAYFARIIHSTKVVAPTEVSDYELIVRGVEEAGYQFNPSSDDEAFKQNMDILCQVFGVSGPDDRMLEGIDLKALFKSTYKKTCTPSIVLATKLLDYWSDCLLKPESSIFFVQAGLDEDSFSNFVTNFTNMMRKVDLSAVIADGIKEYVDYTPAIAPHNEELIADIATNIYNGFVMNLGYDLLTPDDRIKTAKLCQENNLPQIQETEEEGTIALTDKEQLNSLFNQLEKLNDGEGGQLLQLPSYINMKRWIAYVFMSFTIAFDASMTKAQREANRQLGEIIKKTEQQIQILN